jgi:hypothetical protein
MNDLGEVLDVNATLAVFEACSSPGTEGRFSGVPFLAAAYQVKKGRPASPRQLLL